MLDNIKHQAHYSADGETDPEKHFDNRQRRIYFFGFRLGVVRVGYLADAQVGLKLGGAPAGDDAADAPAEA